MKTLKVSLPIILFLFLTTPLFSQTYLNIDCNTGSDQYGEIDKIVEITFNAAGDQMTINYNGTESTHIFDISDVVDMTFSDTHNGGSPLPVELVSFSAELDDGNVTLNWQTATEVNNYGFEVERKSFDADASSLGGHSSSVQWETIGFIEGAGNSNSPKEYSFTDEPLGGSKVQYRLKQIDTNGSFEYSSIVTVQMGIPDKYELKQNYPNPFNPTTTISYNIPLLPVPSGGGVKGGLVTLKIYDILGREVAVLVNEQQEPGRYKVEWNAASVHHPIGSGVYFCRLNAGEYTFLIKMILVK